MTSSAEENKGYKFRFEIEDIMYDENDNGNRPQNKCRFIGYGNTAKEAIDNYEELLAEWHRHIEKEMKIPLNNKKELT